MTKDNDLKKCREGTTHLAVNGMIENFSYISLKINLDASIFKL
jgi:hypothetical protein